MVRKYAIFSLLLLFIPLAVLGKAQEKLTLILDNFPNPNHAPIVIAKQLNYFKAVGLDVELMDPTDRTDQPDWVVAKKADIGITNEPRFMQQVDDGLPLIRIGTLIDKPLACIVALKKTGILELSDLRNKRVGSNSHDMNNIFLTQLLLNYEGIKKTPGVKLIDVKDNLTQALLSKHVDAVTGMMRNTEIPQLESLGHEVTVFFPEEHNLPTYSELIFVAHLDRIHDTKLKQFMSAIERATRFIQEYPNDAWKIFAKTYPLANTAINRKIWFYTIPYFDESPSYFDKKEWDALAQFMLDNHLIKTKYPVDRYAIQLS